MSIILSLTHDGMRVVRHIILCLAVCLSAACVPEMLPPTPSLSSGIELTLVCNDAIQTKTEGTESGVRSYHENLISWVDLYFFAGKMPESNVTAWKDTAVSRLHYRLTAGDQNQSSFQMSISGSAIESLFTAKDGGQRKMTVLAIANYPGTTITDAETPTFSDLDSIAVHADFVSPTDHRQDRFMMRGVKVLDLIDAGADLVCKDTVRMERYASKMTVSVHVKDTVHLAVQTGTNDAGTETVTVPEVWRPMLDGMVIYMENGVNSVCLGGRDSLSTSYFSYSDNSESWYRFVSKDRQGNYSPLVGTEEVVEGGKSKTYYETYPMYMYPQRWEYGSVTSPTTEPDLKLIIPWYRDEYVDTVHNIHITPTQKQCYYKVIMPSSFNREFRSNYWYFLRLDVQILGALTDETPVTITGDSYIVNWQNYDVVVRQAEVGMARYLSLDQNTWEVNNLNELSIPYVSSHPLTISDIVVTRPYFGNVAAGLDTLGGTVVDSTGDTKYLMYDEAHRKAISEDGKDWFSDSGSSIEFKHTLNNNYKAKRFDYSPYTITFRIKHADNEDYQQEVKIIQYPAIYISRIRNSDPVTDAAGDTIARHTPVKDTALARSKYYGFTFVDGAYKYNETKGKFDFYPGKRQERNNADPAKDDFHYLKRDAEKTDYKWRAVFYTGGSIDMYNIHISVLPSDFGFVIGDPRVSEIDNLGYHFYPSASDTMLVGRREDFSVADAMFGLPQRHLAFYYPTEASERTRNMLAPSYRVCSKFGGTEFDPAPTLQYARYRCAAYQEDGFPAGRWRVPTQAEVSFIAQLSANGTFEVLFNDGSTYWSANGAVKVTASGVTPSSATTALLRCVYDTWYWGEDQSEYDAWRIRYGDYREGQYLHDKFVWGDRPR